MDHLEGIYRELLDMGVVESQYDFSRNWLGQSRSYYSSLKARKGQPGLKALVSLYLRLDDIQDGLQSCQSAQLMAETANRFDTTCQMLWNEVQSRAEH